MVVRQEASPLRVIDRFLDQSRDISAVAISSRRRYRLVDVRDRDVPDALRADARKNQPLGAVLIISDRLSRKLGLVDFVNHGPPNLGEGRLAFSRIDGQIRAAPSPDQDLVSAVPSRSQRRL